MLVKVPFGMWGMVSFRVFSRQVCAAVCADKTGTDKKKRRRALACYKCGQRGGEDGYAFAFPSSESGTR